MTFHFRLLLLTKHKVPSHLAFLAGTLCLVRPLDKGVSKIQVTPLAIALGDNPHSINPLILEPYLMT